MVKIKKGGIKVDHAAALEANLMALKKKTYNGSPTTSKVMTFVETKTFVEWLDHFDDRELSIDELVASAASNPNFEEYKFWHYLSTDYPPEVAVSLANGIHIPSKPKRCFKYET